MNSLLREILPARQIALMEKDALPLQAVAPALPTTCRAPMAQVQLPANGTEVLVLMEEVIAASMERLLHPQPAQ
jgi:hypothetical protein